MNELRNTLETARMSRKLKSLIFVGAAAFTAGVLGLLIWYLLPVETLKTGAAAFCFAGWPAVIALFAAFVSLYNHPFRA